MMSDLYVDLGAAGTGHAGTKADPFSAADYFSFNGTGGGANDGDVFHFKNQYAAPQYGTFKLGYQGTDKIANTSIVNWSNEPWRMHVYQAGSDPLLGHDHATYPSAVNLKNGIIQSDSAGLHLQVGGLYETMLLRARQIYIDDKESAGGSDPDMILRGCSLSNDSGYSIDVWCGGFKYIEFKDTTVEATYIFNLIERGQVLAMAHCMLTAADFVTFNGIGGTSNPFTSVQVDRVDGGWTPPTWPAWDAAKSEYAFNKLGAGITVPGSREW